MAFISLSTGKLHKKAKIKKLKNFLIGYVGKFYRTFAQNIDSSVNENFSCKLPTMHKYHQKMFKNIFW